MKCKLRLSYHVKLANQKIIQVRLIAIFPGLLESVLNVLVVQSDQNEPPFAKYLGSLAWHAASIFDFLREA